MTKKRLFDEIKQNPARIYRSPGDVLRDRRFGDAERLEILRAWAHAMNEQEEDADQEIAGMITELEGRLDAPSHQPAR